jgi:outer membrane protein assembly factor BamB
LVYVVTGYQQFGVVDLATGSFQAIGAPTPEPQANLVWSTGGALLSLTVSGNLVRVNPATGSTSVIGQTGLGYNAFDLAGVRGRLYVTDFSNNIYSVDQATGAATLLQATGIAPDPNAPFTLNPDGTFNLCDESLYGMNGKLYATFDAFAIDPNSGDPNYLGLTTFVQPTLYRIDPFTGAATAIGSTDLQLGATVAVGGTLYAFRLVVTGFVDGFPVGYSQLVSVDLDTGRTKFIRNIDPAAGPIFGAAPVLPQGGAGAR